MPPTLLTLPFEIRDLLWELALTSPTGRVLPVHYGTEPFLSSDSSVSPPPSPMTWPATIPEPSRYSHIHKAAIAAALRISFTKKMYFAPCAPDAAIPLTPTALPLPYAVLPLVSRQVWDETRGCIERFWALNTLVLPERLVALEVLAYLGKPHIQKIQRIELGIGNIGIEEESPGDSELRTMKKLAKLGARGTLRELRLLYVDDGQNNQKPCEQKAWRLWFTALYKCRTGGYCSACGDEYCDWTNTDWGDCQRSVVAEEADEKTDSARGRLARVWGVE